MRTILFFCLIIFSGQLIGQVWTKYDSTMKIGKAGYRISCLNRSPEKNVLNIRPIGFKSDSREASIELKARVFGAEIDDLNNDGFPDLIIFIEDAAGKKSIFPICSQDNERIAPILFPDIYNDMELSKGYRGKDEYKWHTLIQTAFTSRSDAKKVHWLSVVRIVPLVLSSALK